MVANARVVFERWMRWEPDHNGWNAYVRFRDAIQGWGSRAKGVRAYWRVPSLGQGVRAVGQVRVRPGRDRERARGVRVRGGADGAGDGRGPACTWRSLSSRSSPANTRARPTPSRSSNLPKEKARRVFQTFASFEKQHGDRQGIEDVVLGKRRVTYEEDVRSNPENYDAWFDYAHDGRERGGFGKDARGVRARRRRRPTLDGEAVLAAVHLPLDQLRAVRGARGEGQRARARGVHRECLKLVLHASFSFSKIWILAAKFEIRRRKRSRRRARSWASPSGSLLKAKIFETYVDMEMQLGNVDRCRVLYQKALEANPTDCGTWTRFANLERASSARRARRAVFELAAGAPTARRYRRFSEGIRGLRDRGGRARARARSTSGCWTEPSTSRCGCRTRSLRTRRSFEREETRRMTAAPARRVAASIRRGGSRGVFAGTASVARATCTSARCCR